MQNIKHKKKSFLQGLFSRITFREPVFLGGTGNITGLATKLPVFDGMTGCIRKFIANEHEYNFAPATSGDVTNGFDVRTYRLRLFIMVGCFTEIITIIKLYSQRNVRRIGVADMHAIMVESVYRPIRGRFVCVH